MTAGPNRLGRITPRRVRGLPGSSAARAVRRVVLPVAAIVLMLPAGGYAAPAAAGCDVRAGAALVIGIPRAGAPADGEVTQLLQRRLEAGRALGELFAGGEALLARPAVEDFYVERGFAPVWTGNRALRRGVAELIDALDHARVEALDGCDYHRSALDSLVTLYVDGGAYGRDLSIAGLAGSAAGALTTEAVADLELLLTDAFLLFARHLHRGRVDPRTVDPAWRAVGRRGDAAEALRRALVGVEDAPPEGVRAVLSALRPSSPVYRELTGLLGRLGDIVAAGGWGRVPAGPTLRPGESDPRVSAVRARLTEERVLVPDAPDPAADPAAGGDPDLFDAPLEAAVRAFQGRHGLEPDGVVGERTLEALNVEATARVDQVRANLERWRWLPDDLGRRHIRVNIASFSVDVIEDGRSALHMRAIVGRPFRKTPVFSEEMRYLVLAPYWHVPASIAAADKLPLIRQDPGYLRAQRMTLFEKETGAVVDPTSVDWSAMDGATFNRRFLLRQEPGPMNALGNMKFMFPNDYNVYLHDTPSRELFDRSQRDFSSGCIRLEDPEGLARYLLGPEWPVERIRQVVAAGVERTVMLPEPIPVHILYFTVQVDADGRPSFLPDVYERDGAVIAALDRDRPLR